MCWKISSMDEFCIDSGLTGQVTAWGAGTSRPNNLDLVIRLPDCRAAYIERQLAAFAQGMRRNDINEQMRIIAAQLTPVEMHTLGVYYGAQPAVRVPQPPE